MIVRTAEEALAEELMRRPEPPAARPGFFDADYSSLEWRIKRAAGGPPPGGYHSHFTVPKKRVDKSQQ